MRVTIEDDDTSSANYSARGAEASRRAGWARAFDAIQRADSAEHDVNVLRDDLRLLTNFSARLYGILEVIAGKHRINELFRGDNHALKSYLPKGALDEGGDAGRKLLGKKTDELTKLRQEIAAMQSDHHVLSQKAFQAAMHKSRQELLQEFNIPDEDALLAWLAQYPGAS